MGPYARGMSRTAREIANVLLALHDDLPEIRVPEDHYQAAELAYGWYARVWHTTKALLILHDAGFDPEASPMRRSLIEHALALQWIGHRPDAAYDAHVAAHQYEVEKFAKKPGSSTAVPREALDELLALELDGGNEAHLVHTYDLRNKVRPSGRLRRGGGLRPGAATPSWRSAAPYRNGRVGQLALDEAMPVVWLALASAGMSLLLEGDPWAETINRCVDELVEPLQAAKAAEVARQAASGGASDGSSLESAR